MGHDKNPGYWDEFSNLQHIKHALIREYLNGWFPKLGLWSGRIVYLDTHAGRGAHRTGESGSPVVALETLLSHKFRDRILEASEAKFLFIEYDSENVQALVERVRALGDLPDRVDVRISAEDCYTQLEELLAHFESTHSEMAPAFVFVDPYGFKVPGALLARLVSAGRVELFVNVIWRELDMAIAQAQAHPGGAMAQTLELVFGDNRWSAIDRDASFDDRADQAIDLLRDAYGAKWATSIRMLGPNGATRYLLAHFTNHPDGRDLMKDCIWKFCPDGEFHARRSDNPKQTRLIVPEPDLSSLEDWVLLNLVPGPRRWSELEVLLLDELWRNAHMSSVIRRLRRERKIIASDYSPSFSRKANPLLSLAEEK